MTTAILTHGLAQALLSQELWNATRQDESHAKQACIFGCGTSQISSAFTLKMLTSTPHIHGHFVQCIDCMVQRSPTRPLRGKRPFFRAERTAEFGLPRWKHPSRITLHTYSFLASPATRARKLPPTLPRLSLSNPPYTQHLFFPGPKLGFSFVLPFPFQLLRTGS